jgi:hypothetical protein
MFSELSGFEDDSSCSILFSISSTSDIEESMVELAGWTLCVRTFDFWLHQIM